MKKLKTLLPILLIVAMCLSCFTIVSNAMSTKKEYDAYMVAASKAAEKKISIDVDDAYAKALEVKETPEIYLKWGEYYYNIEDYSQSTEILETASSSFGKDAKIYTSLMKNYLKIEDYENFFTTYRKCCAIGATDKEMVELFNNNKYLYALDYDYFGEAYQFSSGVARVASLTYTENEAKQYGYVSDGGIIEPHYAFAGDFNSGEISIAPVVNNKGEAYYITKAGRRKYVISPKNIQVKELGVYASERLSVFDGDKYYLCDIDSNVIAGPFDYISTINSIGVVKNGDKWNVIDKDGKIISNKTYTNVILDSKNVAYRKGMFVEQDNVYFLVDEKGNKITNTSFEDARLFIDGYAAVKNNGKWGFINEKGELIIDYIYHDALSFSNGFAAVKMNGLWGYITLDKENKPIVAIDYKFEDAIGFSSNSYVTMVKNDGYWQLLRLYLKQGE